jgi:hypothetical protein
MNKNKPSRPSARAEKPACSAESCVFQLQDLEAVGEMAGIPQPVCRVITELQILYHAAKTLQSGSDL